MLGRQKNRRYNQFLNLAIMFLTWSLVSGEGIAADDRPFILLQSTTSTENSGLFDHILPFFMQQTGIMVRVVAVGTGQAIRNARNGDGDLLLVHAKKLEEEFVAQGYGLARFNVMYNDFLLVGPAADPVGIAHSKDVVASLVKIAQAEAVFVSRGDDSGTHKIEQQLWKEGGVNIAAASGSWYRETGAGMGATLNIGIGMNAYILTDRASWIAFGNKRDHQIQVAGDPKLFNQYGIITINPAKHPHVKVELAQKFVDWILSKQGQKAIADHKIAGEQLFFPNISSD